MWCYFWLFVLNSIFVGKQTERCYAVSSDEISYFCLKCVDMLCVCALNCIADQVFKYVNLE